MKIKNLLSVIRSNQSRKGLFVILHCDTNFVSLSDGVVKELAIQKKASHLSSSTKQSMNQKPYTLLNV